MLRTKQAARRGVGGGTRFSGGKRKRKTIDNGDGVVNSGDERPNRKVATAQNSVIKSKRTEQVAYDERISTATPEDLASRFTEAIKKFKGELSTIELDDQSFPAKVFEDTTTFDETRVVKHLAGFLQHVTAGGREELSSSPKENGSPHTLIVTPSAIRAQALLAEVRDFGTETNKIAKLYAKHMKMKDHITYVRKTRFGIGGGSSHRIQALIEEDVLKLGELKRVVIDGSFVDEKQRTIFSDKDAFLPTLSLLNLDALKLRLISGETRLVVF